MLRRQNHWESVIYFFGGLGGCLHTSTCIFDCSFKTLLENDYNETGFESRNGHIFYLFSISVMLMI